MHCAGRLIAIVFLGMAAACSPTYDWREVRSAEGVVALFPCRPDTHSRDLIVAGDPVTMELSSCSAGGLTFAVGRIVVTDAARVEPVLQALRDALLAKLAPSPDAALADRPAASASAPASQASMQRIRVQGAGPDGERRQVQSRFFSRGLTVYQATVVGKDGAAEAANEATEFFLSSMDSKF